MRYIRVALVLTAGGLKEIYGRNGKRLPFWYHWPLFKKRIKKLEERGKVTVRHKEELKGETIARLQTALELFLSGVVSLIFCTGGYSPRRKKLGIRDSVAMMKEWLVNHGAIQKSTIGEAMSVDTGGNIEEFIQILKKMKLSNYRLTIYLVTSWYHLFRSKRELINALELEGISATIISVAAFPKFDAETLKYEYLWNLLTEPIKVFSLIFPKLKFSWRKREYEARS